MDKDSAASDSALEHVIARAEEQERVSLELGRKYDRMLGDLTASPSWRVSRFLSAIWARSPITLRRMLLEIDRRACRGRVLARLRKPVQDERDIEELRKQLIRTAFLNDIWIGDRPKVSVVSPLYKSRASLAAFLKALRNQEYGGTIEVVLVDDKSPEDAGDAAMALASDLINKRFLVEIVRNDENLGNCGSRNRGIAAATGDYLVVIDPDCIVNRWFIQSHVHHHLRGFDVVLGPMGIESGNSNAEDLVDSLERFGPTAIAPHMRLQDISAPASGVNCVTRNFSVSKEMLDRLGRPLFDERYAYRNTHDTGYGWEDVQMGVNLRQAGARIAFSWDAFSVHMSHDSAIDDGIRARGSAKNFIRLIGEHPELAAEAPHWAGATAVKIARWQRIHGLEDPYLSEIGKQARTLQSTGGATDVTVYSAVAGGYDRIRPARRAVAKRHVLFSDDASEVPGWNVRSFDMLRADPVRTAKAPKVLAHRHLSDCEWSVWIDGNIELIATAQSLVSEVERSGCSIGVFRHPARYCAFDEGATCMTGGKDAAERITAQLQRYEKEGFPPQFGLAECNVIVRRHNDPAVKKAMEIWWGEIENGSRRDQISFNYALWTVGLVYHELANGLTDVRFDKRFVYHPHLTEHEPPSPPMPNSASVAV